MQTKSFLSLALILIPLFFSGQSLQISAMAPLPDQGRDDAVGFSVDGLGYILGGRKTDFALSPQVWAYDPIADSWQQKADFPGTPRQYVSAFVLNGQAHVIGGLADPGIELSEHWTYDHQSDIWTQLNDFPGGGRFAACAFVHEDRVYFGTGRGQDTTFRDLWIYDAVLDAWNPVAEFPIPFYGALSCENGNEIIISGGIQEDESISDMVWRFDGGGIEEINGLPIATANSDLMHVGGRNLMVGGRTEVEDASHSIMEFKAISTSWDLEWSWDLRLEELMNGRRNGAAFSIGEQGYFFGGKDSTGVKSNELIRLGWKKHNDSSLIVYPNPANSEFTLESNSSFRQFSIYDSKGTMVKSQSSIAPLRSICVDSGDLLSGLYFLRIDDSVGVPIMISR